MRITLPPSPKRLAKRAPLSLLILAVLSSAYAQNPKEDTRLTTLDTLLVKARDESLSEDGNLLINAEQIAENQATRVQDLVDDATNLNAPKSGDFGFAGFNIRGLDGNDVPILIDGLEQGAGFIDTIYIGPNRNYFDIEAFKAVQIDTSNNQLNHFNTLSASVDFVTKDPSDYLGENQSLGGELKFGYDDSDSGFYEVGALAWRKDNWSSLLQYTRRDGSELENYASSHDGVAGTGKTRTLPDPVDYSSNNLLGKVRYELPQYALTLTGEYYQYDADIDALSRYGGLLNYGDYVINAQNDRYRLGLDNRFYGLGNFADEAWFKLNWQNSEQRDVTDQVIGENKFGSPTGPRQKDYSYQERLWQTELGAEKNWAQSWGDQTLRYALVYENIDSSSANITRQNGKTSVSQFAPDAQQTTLGFALEDEIAWANGLHITPQLKLKSVDISPDDSSGQFADFNDSAILPALRISQQVNPNLRLNANYFTGLKTPTIADIYYHFENTGYTILPNADLQSEESQNFELGLEWKTDRQLFNAIAFYNDYQNFIDLASLGEIDSTDYYRNDNIDSAYIYGLELSHWLAFGDRLGLAQQQLSLQTGLTVSESQNEVTGDDLDSVAPLQGLLKLRYLSEDQRLNSFIRLRLAAGKDVVDANATSAESTRHYAGYGITDIGVGYQLSKNWHLNAAIHNLFDKEYYEYLNVRDYAIDSQSYQLASEPGRFFMLNVNWNF